MVSWSLVFSLVPLALFLFLLLVKKSSLLTTSLITLLLVAGFSFFYWRILPGLFFVSFGKGFGVAFDILLIIFGAIFFLERLREAGVIDNIGYYLESFSQDFRVQVILLAWFLENFLEGTAGFGTPSTVVAPLLVGLGLPPVQAVVIALLGNSTSVAFGAAGTPIRVGFAGLQVGGVPFYTALINCLGFLVPVFILWVLTAPRKEGKEEFLEALPFALWSGVAFVLPALLALFFGQEFSSILGAVAGLFLVILTSKLGLFLPKNIRRAGAGERKASLSLFKTILPYAFLIALLIGGKFFLGSSAIVIPVINHSFNLFNPGLAFIIAGLSLAIWGQKKNQGWLAARMALRRTIEPFLVIFSMSVVVQLLINCNQNLSGFPSPLEIIAKSFENGFLPFLAPIAGAFGSFITGSATVSNIMFGSFLAKASSVLSLETGIILSLELVGAAAGNMIALADILAAEAVVGLHNQERLVLKGVIVPCAIYVVLAGLLGFFLVSG